MQYVSCKAIVLKIEVTGYKLQGQGKMVPGILKRATCNWKYLFFKGKCTQIFIPTETN